MTLQRQVDFGRLMMNIRAEEQKADLETRDLEKNTTEIGWYANNSQQKLIGVKGAKGKGMFFSWILNLENKRHIEKTHKQFLRLMSILRLPYEFPREFYFASRFTRGMVTILAWLSVTYG